MSICDEADLKYLLRVYPWHRMNEYTCPVDPRAEHVGPGWLGPAGVRDVPVNIIVTQVHPVLSRDAMTKSVAGTRHLSHFRIPGSTAGKEHLHHVCTLSVSGLQRVMSISQSTIHATASTSSSTCVNIQTKCNYVIQIAEIDSSVADAELRTTCGIAGTQTEGIDIH